MKTAAITVIFASGTGGVLIGGPIWGFIGVTIVLFGIWAICTRIQDSRNNLEIDKHYEDKFSKPEYSGYHSLKIGRKLRFFNNPDRKRSLVSGSGQATLC